MKNRLPDTEKNLTNRVAALLRDELTNGQYKPGDVLPPEQIIADRLGVSRTVLREAVSRLKVEGIVNSKQGRGLVVLDNRRSAVLRLHSAPEDDLAEILGIIELRLGFEIEAAAFAATRRNAKDIEEMSLALAQMREAIANGDVAAGVDADFRFHRAIAAATRNPNYIQFFEFISDLLQRNLLVSRSRSARSSGRGHQAQEEHEAIFEAIAHGDAESARRAARTHVERTGERLRSQRGARKLDKARLLNGLPSRRASK